MTGKEFEENKQNIIDFIELIVEKAIDLEQKSIEDALRKPLLSILSSLISIYVF